MSTTTAVQPTNKGRLSCAEVLNIAERDALIAYRDLSGFRVTLELRPDGWHVDYDLTEPLIAGGGPHYVIDPLNGQIRAKRYEQ